MFCLKEDFLCERDTSSLPPRGRAQVRGFLEDPRFRPGLIAFERQHLSAGAFAHLTRELEEQDMEEAMAQAEKEKEAARKLFEDAAQANAVPVKREQEQEPAR